MILFSTSSLNLKTLVKWEENYKKFEYIGNEKRNLGETKSICS